MTSPSLEAAADQSSQRIVLASNGNTPWAQGYAELLRETVIRRAGRQERNVQRRLGPSELDHACDRMVIGKMAGARADDSKPRDEGDNHISDPWASIVGTAIHAWLEDAFQWDNSHGPVRDRWFTERRVTPDPGSEQPHPGTADLYDRVTSSLVDHKGQSEGVRDKLRRSGPPQHYFGQMLLYATGYMHLGYPVDRIVLASWPRTKSSLDDLYIWEHAVTTGDVLYVVDLIEKTRVREEVSKHVAAGAIDLYDIPMTPVDESCHYCPFYRPQAAYDPSVRGCPGTVPVTSN